MLRKREPKQAAPPVTIQQLVSRHQELAEQHLTRSAKAGRLEAETRHATMATAHATLAVSYQLTIQAARDTAPPPMPQVDLYEPAEDED